MFLPPVRAIVLSVAAALAAFGAVARAEAADAPRSAVRLRLDSVTSLDPSR